MKINPLAPKLSLLLAICLAAVSHMPARAQALLVPTETPPISVTYPEQLDGFSFIGLKADGNSAVGTQLGYQSQGLSELILHAFVYLIGFSADQAPVLDDFDKGFLGYMQGAKDQGAFDDFRLVDHGRLPIDYSFGRREGVWQLFTLTHQGVENHSLTYLFYRAPFAIKIRATHPANFSPDLLRKHVDHFATQLLPQLTMRNERDCQGVAPVNLAEKMGEATNRSALIEQLKRQAQMGCVDFDVLVASTVKGSSATRAPESNSQKEVQ